MNNAPRSPLRSRLSRAAALRAVKSLLKWIQAQNSKKNTATSRDDSIFLILSLTKTPHKLQSKPYRIPLPNSPHDPSSISLILDDRPNSLPTLSSARDLVRSLSLPISQFLSFSDLRSGILPSGELQIVDRRISRLLRSIQKKGKSCKIKRNMIVEVDFRKKVWAEYVRLLCFSTVLNLGSGSCIGIRVGRASQGSDAIVDNLIAAADGAARNVPRKWSNVKSFHLKTSESLALPIYEKSNWSHNKVDDDYNDDSEEEEEERMEDEKHGKIERMAEGATGKRARNGCVLNLER